MMRLNRIALMCLASLLACLPVLAKEQTAVRKVLRIGGDQSFPPYEYLNAESKPDGYNVELTRAIAEVMGYDVEFRLGKWSKVRTWLDSGEVDVIMGMAFSPDRTGKYAFSLPHTETWRCFFVRKDSPFNAPHDLTDASIALQEGDIATEYLDVNRFKGKRMYVPSQEDALIQVFEGKFDAAVVTYKHGMQIIRSKKLQNLKPIDEPFSPRFYCFAVRKSNSLLLNDFNTGLSILRENGVYQRIQDKWLQKDSLESLSRRLFIRKLLLVVIPLFAVFLAALIWVWLLRRQISRKSKDLQRELEGRLKYESELNREYKMFVNGPVIVYKLQTDPNVVSYVSDNIRQFGYDPKELVLQKKAFSDIIFSEDRERVLEHFRKDLEAGSEFSAKQYRIITANGQICWVFDYTLIVRDTQEAPWFYGYMLDITAQKTLEADLLEAKEKAEAANIAKGHFLSNISHEIRTPLNGILGFIQVLQGTKMNDEQQEYMDLINSAGRTLMKIVNDILDFSKMETGKLDLIITDFNPRFLIDDVIKTFANISDKPKVDLRMRAADNLPTIVYGDMMRLRQILINLMQNALKFTEAGHVEITADVYNTNDEEIRLLFSVRDTGIGIDPMKQRDIFENFMQPDLSVTRKYGGTGLGLSIVKKLVALMGGFIWVESEPSKGSSFFFILSFRTRAADRPRFEQQLETRPMQMEPLPKLNILLVEDEPINQMVTRKQLENWKLNVTTAATGKEALDIIMQQEFDCVLMDVQMPEMDGITATGYIRKQEEGTGRHVPIIAFTAAAMAGDKERFLASGMDDYIAKPIDIEQLYTILKGISGNKS